MKVLKENAEVLKINLQGEMTTVKHDAEKIRDSVKSFKSDLQELKKLLAKMEERLEGELRKSPVQINNNDTDINEIKNKLQSLED